MAEDWPGMSQGPEFNPQAIPVLIAIKDLIFFFFGSIDDCSLNSNLLLLLLITSMCVSVDVHVHELSFSVFIQTSLKSQAVVNSPMRMLQLNLVPLKSCKYNSLLQGQFRSIRHPLPASSGPLCTWWTDSYAGKTPIFINKNIHLLKRRGGGWVLYSTANSWTH